MAISKFEEWLYSLSEKEVNEIANGDKENPYKGKSAPVRLRSESDVSLGLRTEVGNATSQD